MRKKPETMVDRRELGLHAAALSVELLRLSRELIEDPLVRDDHDRPRKGHQIPLLPQGAGRPEGLTGGGAD